MRYFIQNALLACLLPGLAAAQDIRDCPVDRLTFVDPWAGTEFVVDRAVNDMGWVCPTPDGFVSREEGGADCRFLGALHLIGRLDGEPLVASYTAIWGVPCCSWSMTSPEQFGAIAEDGREAPTLGAAAIYPVIEAPDWVEPADPLFPSNPLIPMVCRPG